jgi:hypothetical protein
MSEPRRALPLPERSRLFRPGTWRVGEWLTAVGIVVAIVIGAAQVGQVALNQRVDPLDKVEISLYDFCSHLKANDAQCFPDVPISTSGGTFAYALKLEANGKDEEVTLLLSKSVKCMYIALSSRMEAPATVDADNPNIGKVSILNQQRVRWDAAMQSGTKTSEMYLSEGPVAIAVSHTPKVTIYLNGSLTCKPGTIP